MTEASVYYGLSSSIKYDNDDREYDIDKKLYSTASKLISNEVRLYCESIINRYELVIEGERKLGEDLVNQIRRTDYDLDKINELTDNKFTIIDHRNDVEG